jgi:hypothetical protein
MLKKINCFYALAPLLRIVDIKTLATFKRWDAVVNVIKSHEMANINAKLTQFDAKL